MKKFIFILVMPAFISGIEPTYVLCLHSSYTPTVIMNAVKTYGYAHTDLNTVRGQPFRITNAVTISSGYVIVNITPKNSTQEDYIDTAVRNGYAILLSTVSVINVRNPRYGCLDTEIEVFKYGNIP